MKNSKLIFSKVISFVLIAAMALTFVSCKKETKKDTPSADSVTDSSSVKTVGEGKTGFFFTVTDIDGKETKFSVKTDKKTVGEALFELGLIDGDKSEYGLMVTKANGITANYDTDKTYFAFYIGGKYATVGIDSAEIKEGETYGLKVEK